MLGGGGRFLSLCDWLRFCMPCGAGDGPGNRVAARPSAAGSNPGIGQTHACGKQGRNQGTPIWRIEWQRHGSEQPFVVDDSKLVRRACSLWPCASCRIQTPGHNSSQASRQPYANRGVVRPARRQYATSVLWPSPTHAVHCFAWIRFAALCFALLPCTIGIVLFVLVRRQSGLTSIIINNTSIVIYARICNNVAKVDRTT